jgi:hypothetical protein
VAGAWMGLAVKTDGAAVAAGGITESLILAKAAAEGIKYQPGWILGTAATVKVFIDIFIGIWAFVLGWIWTNHINKAGSDKAKIVEIWERFPKFIIGFVITFAVGLYLALGTPADIASKVPAAIGEANAFRVIFFILTFFSIGVLSDFRMLWQRDVEPLLPVEKKLIGKVIGRRSRRSPKSGTTTIAQDIFLWFQAAARCLRRFLACHPI